MLSSDCACIRNLCEHNRLCPIPLFNQAANRAVYVCIKAIIQLHLIQYTILVFDTIQYNGIDTIDTIQLYFIQNNIMVFHTIQLYLIQYTIAVWDTIQ